ncbi:MAG: iron-sulfur cluster assembly accessory protein [Chloroflexi bacterium]|nr:iron-sulfur cluster assembly accessory protein [Chloroflexota bacterium]
MISVSELASEKLKGIMQEEGQPDSALRIMVVPGPHGGAQYMLSLEKEAKAEDSVIDAYGVRILVDSDSLPLLEGSEIDYVDGLMRSGFVISNPNFMAEGGGCACGGEGGCGCGGHEASDQHEGGACACGGEGGACACGGQH